MKKIIAALLVIVLALTSFNVDASAASVKLNKKKKTIYVGDTFKLKLKNAKSGEKITWKSSDKSIASVNDSGKVTANKKGKATITATYKKKDYKCVITVKKKKTDSSVDFSKA
ncbi:MAG: Ig-like domain-containing protein, partial [Lachnospiraceae bacterium]|nr:Ig-like domain-containing protein [Lachnospiraceae bacterium]